MAENAVTTPSSTADHDSGAPAKASAIKDRLCPYCNTLFTSSSLGRHLDLYIKERNPKPSDGIHNVDEIRRQRGNITRRQARNSSAKGRDSTPPSSRPTPAADHASPSVLRKFINTDNGDGAQVTISLNRANWQSTGVINDLPPTPRHNPMSSDGRRDNLRRGTIKNDVAKRQKALEERDRGKAAELALQEVLDSIKAADSRAHPPAIFPFDFHAQTFPAICFRCLPSPPSIASTIPMPSSTSWPIKPPGSSERETLHQRIAFNIEYWKKQNLPSIYSASVLADVLESSADSMKALHEHIDTAFREWMALPESTRTEIWHLEALRAFAREETTNGEISIKLVKMEQEIANLKAQVGRLGKCQQPREFMLCPPTTTAISTETLDALSKSTEAVPDQWDFEARVAKWKARIQSDRSFQRSLPQLDTTTDHGTSSNGAPFSAPPNAGFEQLSRKANGDYGSGIIQAQMYANGGHFSDEDLMDAPGEEEDDDMEGNGARGDLRGMLDPKLRERVDGMVGVEGMNGVGRGMGSL